MSKISFFLTFKKLDFFKIKKINDLTYKLDLPFFMKIHFVISVIHLNQIKKNAFERFISFSTAGSDFIIVDGKKKYVVEKLVKAETKDGISGFIIKWKSHDEKTWQSEKILTEDVPDVVRKFKARKRLIDQTDSQYSIATLTETIHCESEVINPKTHFRLHFRLTRPSSSHFASSSHFINPFFLHQHRYHKPSLSKSIW